MNARAAAMREQACMNQGLAVSELAPLEYRVALDAASVWLSQQFPWLVRCEQPALLPEIRQRLPISPEAPWWSALWLEPQRAGWQAALAELGACLPGGARLAVLLSLPPARRLPERQGWSVGALGETAGGLRQLRQAMPQHGFELACAHGLHTGQAVIYNAAARLARRLGRLALGDRLEFAARRCYTQPLSRAWLATCVLLQAVRQ